MSRPAAYSNRSAAISRFARSCSCALLGLVHAHQYSFLPLWPVCLPVYLWWREEMLSDPWQPEATSSPSRRILEQGVKSDKAAASLARDCRSNCTSGESGTLGRGEKLLTILRLRSYGNIWHDNGLGRQRRRAARVGILGSNYISEVDDYFGEWQISFMPRHSSRETGRATIFVLRKLCITVTSTLIKQVLA